MISVMKRFWDYPKLYIDDKRFTKNIDKHKDGLTDFISKSIQIYCK